MQKHPFMKRDKKPGKLHKHSLRLMQVCLFMKRLLMYVASVVGLNMVYFPPAVSRVRFAFDSFAVDCQADVGNGAAL
jgi:hypothetical protein